MQTNQHRGMMRLGVIAALVLVLMGAGVAIAHLSPAATPSPSTSSNLSHVDVPAGFRIDVFANESLGGEVVRPHGGANPGVRFMAFHDGTLFVAIPGTESGEGAVVALPDGNDDGRADRQVTVVEGLDRPNSIAFHDDRLYVANTFSVVRYEIDGLTADPASKDVVVRDLAESNQRAAWTTTIEIHNESLWISKGTAVKSERPHDNGFREKITKCSLDGEDCETIATGLRNAVGMTATPAGRLVVTEMGMGHTDPEYPPDELNVITNGSDYGWPYCHADDDPIDPSFVAGEDNPHRELLREHEVNCSEKEPPTMAIPAHSAPLGLTVYTGTRFPEKYRGDLFVAYHGSWGMDPPIGYEIVRIECGDRFAATCRAPYEVHDFATGWQNEETPMEPFGRPVDVVVGPDGALYASDDQNGVIYRIWYAGEQTKID